MAAESDIHELARMADLALHVYWEEMTGNQISDAGGSMPTLLQNVQRLAKEVRQRFIAP